ncbi:MAG TPA: tetratricopeptide repeat protein [Rhodocyclaceae bacterium]
MSTRACGIAAVLLATLAAAEEPALRVTRSRIQINPALAHAYSSWNAGDLAGADAAYARVLKAEPANRDALHGTAAVALRLNDRDRAEDAYRRAVAADPNDAVAQAGLAGLQGEANPLAAESRLKSLIAGQPDQPCLQFALGNAYAAMKRWNDAQRAFFSAHAGDPGNPDYLFNLAISLDHLREHTLALSYYGKAIAAAGRRPAAFDPALAAARLKELQR